MAVERFMANLITEENIEREERLTEREEGQSLS